MELQPIDITEIIVAMIGAGGAIIVQWIKSRRILRERRELQRGGELISQPDVARIITRLNIMICICICLLVISLGNVGWRHWGPTTKIETTYPYDGATVEISEMIQGTSQGIPEGHVIWVVVYSYDSDCYYPQNNPADIQADGSWSSLAIIGIGEDVSKRFDIIIVLADERAQDIFNTYITQAIRNESWPGLESLPEGVTIYARILVTRK